MPNRLRFDGFADLKDALRRLPQELTDDAAVIVRRRALEAAGAIRAGYPRRTGKLQDGVVVEAENSGDRFGVRYVVKNKARHAYIYEYGTAARHYITKRGVTHQTGIMPAAPPGRAFIPKMITARAMMMDDLAWLLINAGLDVKRAAA